MDLQLVQKIQSYNHLGQERRTGVQLLKEIDAINSDFNNWLNVVQGQKEEALHELEGTNIQLREVEQMHTNLSSNVNSLERMIEEKKCETKKLDGLKQQYLLRKGKATARLSQLDVDFIDSLQKRIFAFQHMTGIVWDLPNCDQEHFLGYLLYDRHCGDLSYSFILTLILDVRNVVSKRVKFFEGKVSSSEIWQLTEKISKNICKK